MRLVALDANILCSAILSPKSLNWRVLEHAAKRVPFQGFTTEVAGMEFVRNASEGFKTKGGLKTFDLDEIEEFLDVFDPLFDPDNVATSPIGRSLTGNHALHDQPLGQVVYQLTGRTREELLDDLESQPLVNQGSSVAHFDPFDLHLALAAVEREADYLCTSNTKDYSMSHIGPVRIATPEHLVAEFSLRS